MDNNTDQPPETSKTVMLSINVRYQMAWTEVSTRIAQRQNALYLYIVIAGAIIGACSQGIWLPEPGGLLGKENATRAILFQFFGLLGVPFIGIVFALLNRKHEGTIAILRLFLSRCEEANEATAGGVEGFQYNADPHLSKRAAQYRNLHDLVFAISISLATFAGTVIAGIHYIRLDSNVLNAMGQWAGFGLYTLVTLVLAGTAIAIVCWPIDTDDIQSLDTVRRHSRGSAPPA